jgi:hypothetical protein
MNEDSLRKDVKALRSALSRDDSELIRFEVEAVEAHIMHTSDPVIRHLATAALVSTALGSTFGTDHAKAALDRLGISVMALD